MVSRFFKSRPAENADRQDDLSLSALQRMAVPTFVLNADGRVALWNPACEALTGIKAEDVMGTDDHWKGFYKEKRPCLADLAFGKNPELVANLYATQSREMSGPDLRAENWCDLPSGGRRYLLIDACPIMDDKGEVVAVVETLRDETRQEEKRLEQEEAQQTQTAIVDDIGKALRRLAGGDLAAELTTPFPSQYEPLRENLNYAVSHLRETISSVISNTVQIDHSCTDLLSASASLSERTGQQAANLQQTVASLAQISEGLQATSEGAAKANHAIDETMEQARNSAEIVQDTIAAMKAIDDFSSQINQVVAVIEELAFQTNLLALNAGVEAARAGEAGRGFAVVAQEVRELAQRSAKESSGIKALLETSKSQVRKGVELVDRTGESLQAIVEKAGVVDQIVTELAGATEEHSRTVNDIQISAKSLDQLTTQNAQMAEEGTEANQKLVDQARRLAEMLRGFQVTNGDRTASGGIARAA
ncbi:methyl-accepting chemotaxis protein [Notoacmeibacter sp. MSK16QG-6]|uniref:methyl-accepting chemotaxis protein n=1 Tax=Notoacmeibacter sp. MSK16QG-6 TaxID=2957982 RepID=UPI0020A097A7|nr:methyl-accepting chemotaxis protein [Notoacmeibacter sp. MSK16QG-6]MCP1200942.1 methyl-accepting chemotaxis protein [Notoacmeibacter sp. MSK16QG-6]